MLLSFRISGPPDSTPISISLVIRLSSLDEKKKMVLTDRKHFATIYVNYLYFPIRK